MTALLSADVIAKIVTSQAINGTLDTIVAAINVRAPVQFTPGSGSGQISVYWASQRTLTASSTETLDLTALTDSLGNTITFATIKAILIDAADANTNDVVVGAAAATQFVGPLGGTATTITNKPGAGFIIGSLTGWTVDSTHKSLKIANSSSGTSVTYDIIIVGN